MSKRAGLAKLLCMEIYKRPIKSLVTISLLLSCILATALIEVKIAELRTDLLKNPQDTFSVAYKYCFSLIACSFTQQGKLLAFQFLFDDLIGDLLCKSVNMVLFRRWEYRNPHITGSDEEKRQIFTDRAYKSGSLQVFMHKGIKGMTVLVNIVLCTALPRFITLFFLTRSKIYKDMNTFMQIACIIQFVLIIFSSVIAMFAEVSFRKRMINSRADLDGHLAECLNQHDLITYLNTEKYEYKVSKKNILSYKKNLVFTKVASILLTLCIYLISNVVFVFVLMYVNSRYNTFQKGLVITFMNVSGLVERQTVFFSGILIKLRKAILDSSFALEFVRDIDEFDKMADIPQYYKKNNHDDSSETGSTFGADSIESYDMSQKENVPNTVDSTELHVSTSDQSLIKHRQSDFILEFVDFAVNRDNVPIFRPLSQKILRGQKVLIKGRNGIGKTSILRSIFDFIDYTGSILLNGKDIRSYSRRDLVKHFSICPQKAHIFNKTLRENLEYGNIANYHEIEGVCNDFMINQIASRSKEGLETRIQSNSLKISDGEAKRIAIARTILRDAHIYWFDEPTANLDSESEKRIIHTIVSLNATVICILHTNRFDLFFDSILYLED